MSSERRQRLKGLIEKNPNDPFPRYALAMEYKNSGETELALKLFSELLEEHPDYLPTYYHYGTVLAVEGMDQKARKVLSAGIDLARKEGQIHARSELETALAGLVD